MNTIEIRSPYLIFLGSETEVTYAKTGAGLVQWRPELCQGQISLPAGTVDLGLPSLTIDEAVEAGIQSLLIGTAAVGGGIPEDWLAMLEQAAAAGLDIVAGVHTRLNDIDRLKEAAASSGARLVDVRVPPQGLPVGTGKKRSGKRVLTVGTDCAVGKKYRACDRARHESGRPQSHVSGEWTDRNHDRWQRYPYRCRGGRFSVRCGGAVVTR